MLLALSIDRGGIAGLFNCFAGKCGGVICFCAGIGISGGGKLILPEAKLSDGCTPETDDAPLTPTDGERCLGGKLGGAKAVT